jgi:hypothetical protein
VNRALRAINASLGEFGIDPAQLTTFRAQSYCPPLRSAPEILDLFERTPARSLAEAAIGAGKVRPVKSGQIALRFPRPSDPASMPRPRFRERISTGCTRDNGVKPGTISNFTRCWGAPSDLPTKTQGTHRLAGLAFEARALLPRARSASADERNAAATDRPPNSVQAGRGT